MYTQEFGLKDKGTDLMTGSRDGGGRVKDGEILSGSTSGGQHWSGVLETKLERPD